MSKLSLIEKMISAYQKGEVLPIKGHTKITLTDVNTGEVQVTESDNIITNALASILAHNYCLLSNFSKILPLWNYYSGVMCFQEEITENADNYNPPNSTVNPMIANAGQTAHSTASTTRGNPNGGESVFDQDTYIKFVWDWTTNQGNGTIKTVCLCPGVLGDAGLIPLSTYPSLWTPIAVENTAIDGSNLTFPSNRTQCMKLPISISSDGQTGKSIYWSGTTFEEITVKHDWFKFGFKRDVTEFVEVSNRSATVRSMSRKHIFEDDSYYYCYDISTNNKVKIDKVAKSNFAVTQMADIPITVGTIYTSALDFPTLDACIPKFPYDGTYLYLPKSQGNGFIAVNLTNSADQFVLDGTVSLALSSTEVGAKKCSTRPIIVSPGLIFGDKYFINGNKLYPKEAPACIYTNDGNTARRESLDAIRIGASVYGYPCGAQVYNRRGQGAVVLSCFLSSINVLDTAVPKTSSQTMKIEYTITEA